MLTDDEARDVLRNRERAHLRLAVINAITEDRLADAMITLSKLLTDPEPRQRNVCQFCGCSENSPCGIYVATEAEDHHLFAAAMCTWIDDEQTICSNLRCVEKWRRLYPEASYLHTSAESRILTP